MNASPGYTSRVEIGSHVFTAEPNDVLHLHVRGWITQQDAPSIKKFLLDYGKEHPGYSIITVVNDMAGVERGARREFVESSNPYLFGCCYIVGASFAIRTLILGIYRARKVLRPNAVLWTLEMVATEQEARRLIAAKQRENQAR